MNVVMKKSILLFVLCVIGLFGCGERVSAQNLAVKTNLLYDATATINLGVEVGLTPKWTLDVSGNYNPWVYGGNKKMKHWLVQPEARYWSCERFRGHFFGAHLLGGRFNAGGLKLPFGIGKESFRTHRYQGWGVGGGLSYGYHWLLTGRWSLEATIGAGYIRFRYDRYGSSKCSPNQGTFSKNYWGLTRAGVSLIFIIK